MSSPPTKPTILIVPGSFGPPEIYASTISHLRAAGYTAVALQLPSTQKRMPLPPATLSDDANLIKSAAESLISQGKEVVVVAHSYGGTPMTQALDGLKVKRMIYLSAVVPKRGQSQVSALGGEEGVLPMEAVDGYMHLTPLTLAPALCPTLPFDLAYENALHFQHHSGASFLEQTTAAAWESIPVSYLVCEDDLIITPEQQRRFIGVVEEGSGKVVSVVSLRSGHCPNFTMAEGLAEVIAGEVVLE